MFRRHFFTLSVPDYTEDVNQSYSLGRAKLETLFLEYDFGEYLDFSPPKSTIESTAISSRSAAVDKGLENEDLEIATTSHGSPPFSLILELCGLLKDRGILPPLSGLGIEVGAGIALLSCAVLNLHSDKSIQGILALEATKPFVEKGIRRSSQEFLGSRARKVIPCHGVFEKIPVETGALDFGLQIESLHHAEDLNLAVEEIARVLHPGGFFVSIDRSWVDSVSDSTLEEMLNHYYPPSWLLSKNFDPSIPFTRRENGEHEYRDAFWKATFERNGLRVLSETHLHPRLEAWQVLKCLLCLVGLDGFAGIKVKSRKGLIRTYVLSIFGIRKKLFSNFLISPHPRPLTVLILERV